MKQNKIGAKEEIEVFFKNIKNKSAKDVKKIKRFSMKYKIPLKEKGKLFCKKCLIPYNNPKIRIKKQMKKVTCQKCGYVSKWKLKTS